MIKIITLIVITGFLLSACAAQAPTPAVPTAVVFATPDSSVATPTVGSATVQKYAGLQSIVLHSLPDRKSAASGTALPGAIGRIMGLDSSGTWLLLEFKDYSGWAPIEQLNITIAQ